MLNILSVDVEEWFHLTGVYKAPEEREWDALEGTVERNLHQLLDLVDSHGVKITCFFLGWVAKTYPHLVKEAHARGHEIGSHGYRHQVISSQTRQQFSEDIRKAKDIVEQITGEPVCGYRAPSWSITKDTQWALEELVAGGFQYDSSIFPVNRENGGIPGIEKGPHLFSTPAGSIFEFPMSVHRLFGKDWCFFGGGYLRFFPSFLISRMARSVENLGRPVIVYVHPREIDPNHPRLPMPPFKKFKCYVNLSSTNGKLELLMKQQKFGTFKDWLKANGDSVHRIALR